MAKFKYEDFILRFTNLKYESHDPDVTGLADFFLGIRYGESLGLTSETNSGSDTVRDMLFGTIKADQGQIMYYGRSIDEVAPIYMRENYRNLRRERNRLGRIQEKRNRLEAELQAAGNNVSDDLRQAVENARGAFLAQYFNFVQLQGGFVQLDEPDILAPYYSKRYDLALEYRDVVAEIEEADALYRDLQAERTEQEDNPRLDQRMFELSEEMDELQSELVEIQWELEEILGLIHSWKEPYLHSEEFLRHERELDESISLFRLTHEERRHLFRDLQYVPSFSPDLFDPDQTFEEVLQAGLVYQGLFKAGKASTKAYLQQILQMLDMKAEDLQRPITTATNYEAFRLLLGRSLALHPKLIYLDEPLRHLSEADREAAYELILDLRENRDLTLIIASQDVKTLAVLTDRCAVLCEGHLVELYNTQSLIAVPFHPYTAALLASHPEMNGQEAWTKFRLKTDEGDGLDFLSEACPFSPRCLYRGELCVRNPELTMAGSGHFYACHYPLYGQGPQRV